MRKLLLPVIVLQLILISPVLATIGIGVSPMDKDIEYYQGDNHIELPITLVNTGNTDLEVNVTSDELNIDEHIDYFLPKCACEGFCSDPELLECDSVVEPHKLTLKIYNPEQTIVGYIDLIGVGESDGMVKTSVGAKIKIDVTYHDEVFTTTTSTSTTTIFKVTTSPSTTSPSSGGGGSSGTTASSTSSTSTQSTTIKGATTTQRVTNTPTTQPHSVTTTKKQDIEPEEYDSFLEWLLGSSEAFYIAIGIIIIIIVGAILLISKSKSSSQRGKENDNGGVKDFYIGNKGMGFQFFIFLLIILFIAFLIYQVTKTGKLFP
jgi:hypothetical protein